MLNEVLFGLCGYIVDDLLADGLRFFEVEAVEVYFEKGVQSLPIIYSVEKLPGYFPADFLLPIEVLILLVRFQVSYPISMVLHVGSQIILIQSCVGLISFHVHFCRYLAVKLIHPHFGRRISPAI